MLKKNVNNQNKIIDPDGTIAELAEGVARYYIEKYGEIDLEVIAYENKITFSYGDYKDSFDGMLEFDDFKFHIYLNTRGGEPNERTRFSFAHELGHFYISEHSIALINGTSPAHSSYTGFKSENIIERQADYFAANLLMPKDLLLRIYRRKRKFEFQTIYEIQNEFAVSQLAALYRVFFMNLHPLMIVKSKDKKIVGTPIRNRDFYFKLNDKTHLPEDSLAIAINNSFMKESTKKLWLMDWFDVSDHRVLYEHCIYYESINLVYSILWTD